MQIPTEMTKTYLAVQNGVCLNAVYSQRKYGKTTGAIQTTGCKNNGDTLPSWGVLN